METQDITNLTGKKFKGTIKKAKRDYIIEKVSLPISDTSLKFLEGKPVFITSVYDSKTGKVLNSKPMEQETQFLGKELELMIVVSQGMKPIPGLSEKTKGRPLLGIQVRI